MFGYKGVETALAPTPIGPSGKRASMYNGLADSIWVGSDNKPAAAKWVEYLGSPDCQNIVGEEGVVFPAIPSGTDKAEAAFKAKDVDVSRVHRAHQGQDHLLVPDHRLRVADHRHHAARRWTRWPAGSDPASLTEANNEVNALFG